MAAFQQRPRVAVIYGRDNQPVRVPISDLLIEPTQTYITLDTSTAVSGITVKNITGFLINQVLLIGQPGNQNSEVVKTSASVAPSGTGITLAAATAYPHSANTPVYLLNYDQVVFSTAATIGGVKAQLATVSIPAAQVETFYNDTQTIAGFYFARFFNTINAFYSPYSDGVPVAGYGVNTARYLIDTTLNEINKVGSQVLTDEFFFQQINLCQNEIKNELKRWSWLQLFDQDVGTANTGTWSFTLPTNLDDQNTNKSIYNLRVGTGDNLEWVDKERWNDIIENVAYTTIKTAAVAGDTSVALTDSGDFGTSPTLVIGANSYASNPTSLFNVAVVAGGTGYTVADVLTLSGGTGGTCTVLTVSGGVVKTVSVTTPGSGYATGTKTTTGGTGTGCTISVTGLTANNLTTNTITTSTIAVAAAAGVYVFSGASQGQPAYWTTFGGTAFVYPIVAAQYNGQDFLMDYYQILTVIQSDTDTVVIPDLTCIQYYLKWKALKKLNNGMENEGSIAERDGYFARRTKLIQKEVLGKTFIMRPRINNFARLMSSGVDGSTREIRTGNFKNTGL